MSLGRPLNINIWIFTKVWISAFHYFVKRRMGYWGSHEQPSSCGQPQLSVFTYQCSYVYSVYTDVYDTAIPWYVLIYRYLWDFFSNFCFFRCPYKKAYNRKNIKNYKRKRIYKNFYAVKCILQYSVYMCEFLKFFTLPGIALFVFPLRIYTKTNKIH